MSEAEPKTFFDVTTSENTVIAYIDGVETFRLTFKLTFNPQIYADNFYKSLPFPSPEVLQAEVQSILKQTGAERSEEENKKAHNEALQKAALIAVIAEKGKHIAERMSENLDSLLMNVIEDAIRAYNLEGTILLNEQAGKKINISKYKDIILKQHWSRYRDWAGIKQGGARKRKGVCLDERE